MAAVTRHGRIGLSAAHADETIDEKDPLKRIIGGGYGGVGVGRLTLMGELDAVRTTVDDVTQLAALAAGDLLIARGVNLKLAYDWHDRALGVPEDHRSRLVTGIETFPVQYVQASLFYQVRLDIPQAPAADLADRIVLQLHGFF